MIRKISLALIVAAVMFLGVNTSAFADSYTWNATSNNLNNAGAVNATMTVTTTANGFDVTVVNLLANPGNQGQIITGVELHTNSALTSGNKTGLTGSQLQSSSAIIRDIASDGTFSQSGPGQTNWQLSNSFFGGGLALCAAGCGTWHPDGIIGAADSATGLYTNANPSISNGPHSPEIFGTLAQPVTFHVYASGISGVSAANLFDGANFVFGTSGTQLGGTSGPPPSGPGGSVPEPSSIALLASGFLAAVGPIRRKLKL